MRWSFIPIMLLVLVAGSTARADLLAYDRADLDDPYGNDDTFMPGQNGGSGFTDWVQIEQGMAASMFLANPIDGESIRSWGLSGTYALGRGLVDPLNEGIFSTLASYGSSVNAFAGFSLRTSLDPDDFAAGEILRFGLINGAINYSTDQGDTYTDIESMTVWRGMTLRYSVLWSTQLGSFSLTVSAFGDPGLTETVTGSLATGNPVAMLGVGIFESNTDRQLLFDDFQVTTIPEPSSLAFLLLGGLWLKRSYRRR